VACPNSSTIYYDYDQGTLNTVAYPDGTGTTVTLSTNTTAQCLQLDFKDAAAEPTHNNKTVLLTLDTWVNPVTPFNVVAQAYNRVRAIYNGANEVVYFNEEDPTNNQITYYYTGAGRFSSYEQNNGVPVRHRVAKDPDFNNAPSTYTWETTETYEAVNDQQMLTKRTDILNRAMVYENDAKNATVTKVTYPDTTFETTTYNSFRKPLQHTDRLGRITQYTYDGNGNMLTKKVAVGSADEATWSYEYNSKGQLAKIKDPLYSGTYTDLHVTEYEYNTAGYLAKIKQAADVASGVRGETTFVYDSAGRRTSSTDPEIRLVTYAYDTRNRVLSVAFLDNTAEQFAYGTGLNANLLTVKTDRTGRITKMTYDGAGRVTNTAYGFGLAESVSKVCTYLPGTDTRATCIDRGEKTTYGFDYARRLVSSGRQASTVKTLASETLFDLARRVDQSTDEYGRKMFYVYDVNDRVTRTVRETVPGAVTLPVPPSNATYLSQRDTYLNGLSRVLTSNTAYLIDDTEYDAQGQVPARVDPRNIRHTTSHDGQGRVAATVEAYSQAGTVTEIAARTEYSYDAASNRTQVKLPRSFTQQTSGAFVAGSDGNFISAMTYSGRNLLANKTEAYGRTEAAPESYTYWPDGRAKDRTDARSNVWTSMWSHCCGYHRAEAEPASDVDGDPLTAATRAVHVTLRDSENHTTYAYTAPDWTPFPQDPALPEAVYSNPPVTTNETTTRLDGLYRPVARTAWLIELGAVSKNDPPVAGTHGTNAADGLVTRWVYDDNLTDSSGLDVTYSAHLTGLNLGSGSDGSAVEVTNPAGDKHVTIFDGLGRVVKTIDGNSNTTKQTYDAIVSSTPGAPGDVIESTFIDGLTNTSKSRSDGAGRVLSSVDAASQATTHGYDANSNRIVWRDPNSVGQDCVFDARNRDKQCTDTQGDVTKTFFDSHNNVVKTTDALTKDTLCVFDGRDRKTSCTDRISGVTAYTYDGNNNLLTLTDAQSGATSYAYDVRNLLVEELFPGHSLPSNNERRAYTYDAAHRLKSRLDQNLDSTTYAYDRLHRLTTRAYPDTLNDTFVYDAASRLTSAVSARYSNTVARTYDSASRLATETQTLGGVNYVLGYAYDASNRQTSVTYPSGKVVARTFTARNQLATVSFDGTSVVNPITYDNGMRRTTMAYNNGRADTIGYGTRLDNLPVSKSTDGSTTNFAYGWDANKRKTGENDSIVTNNVQTFGYDFEDRLTSFNRSSVYTQAWTLTTVGDWSAFNDNGSSTSRTHNSVHELTAIGATALTYDTKGNLTTNSNAQTYAWDFENRLTSTVVPTGSTIGTVGTHSYKYDALGRRVSKTVAGTTTTVYVSDGSQEIAEYANGGAANAPQIQYVFGNYIDEPLMMISGSNKYYYHNNSLYSVAALTDAAGAVVERYRYDPYGKVTILAADGVTVRTASSYSNPWTYTGRRSDGETGLMYYRARMYDVELGRFISRDPIGYAGSKWNLNEYCGGQPNRYTDPSGYRCCKRNNGTHYKSDTFCSDGEREVDDSFCCDKAAKRPCCEPISIKFKSSGKMSVDQPRIPWPAHMSLHVNVLAGNLGAMMARDSMWNLYLAEFTLFFLEVQIEFSTPCGEGCTWGQTVTRAKGTEFENTGDDTPSAGSTKCVGNTVYYWDSPGQKAWHSKGNVIEQNFTVWAEAEKATGCPSPPSKISQDYQIITKNLKSAVMIWPVDLSGKSTNPKGAGGGY